MSRQTTSWKRWRIVGVALLQLGLAAVPVGAWASPEEADSEESAPASEESSLTSSLSHLIQVTGAYWFNELGRGAHRAWFELEYRPRLVLEWEDGVRIVGEPILRGAVSTPALDVGLSVDDGALDYERNAFAGLADRQAMIFKEAHVGFSAGAVDLAFGWQIFSWGKADAFRPLDVFQTADYTDRLRDERLGILSLSAAWGSDEWLVEGVWVPLPMVDRFASATNNVWSVLPRGPEGFLPSTLDRSGLPELRLDGGEGGLRVSYFGENSDWTLVYARSLDRSPSTLEVSSILASPASPRLLIKPSFERFHLFGASVGGPWMDYLLRLDAAYVLYDRPSPGLVSSGVRLVAGIERRWDLFRGAGTLLATAQYGLDTTAAETFALTDGRLPSPSRVFRHAVTASLMTTWRERYTVELKALTALEPWAWVVRGHVKYKLQDGVVAWMGCDLLNASSGSAISSLRRADRLLVGLELRAQ